MSQKQPFWRRHRVSISIFVVSVFIGLGLEAFVLDDATRDPFVGNAIEDPPFTSLTYSIQGFFWWDTGHAGVHLDWVRNMLNFSAVKHTFPWSLMELRPNEWDFTHSDRIVDEVTRRNLDLIVRLGQVPAWATSGDTSALDTPPDDLATWANYCRTISERYTGRVRAYQVWNEPNLNREWGNQPPDAHAYVELLRACSAAIRQADPNAIVISAGLAPTGNLDETAIRDDIYLDSLYRAGFQQSIDVVGVHATGYGPPSYGPDDAVADGRGRWASFRRIEDLRKIMIQHDDAARQMAILEFGWTTDTVNADYRWFAVTPEQQGQYIVEAYRYAYENWSPWVGLMSLIYLPDPAWTENDEEWWWAITDHGLSLRPAFYAINAADKFCGDQVVPGWRDGWSVEEWNERRIPCN